MKRKTLKLIGQKQGWFGRKVRKIVADIYVDENKRVIVKSRNRKEGEKLQKDIDKYVSEGQCYIRRVKKETDENSLSVRTHYGIIQKPGDNLFLEALKDASWFWRDKNFGDYKIFELSSDIVEE